MRLFLVVFIALLVGGCAAQPLRIDLSNSVYEVTSENHTEQKRIGNLTIINSADDGEFVNTILGSDTIFPIKPETTTKETVEQDLRKFFDNTLNIGGTADQDLTITISKADAYSIWGGAAKIPILGLAFVNADTEFGMNLRVLFEIEKEGKVVSTYMFDEKITIQGKASTINAVALSYQRLIAEYRRRFLGEIESRFVSRYF